MTGVVSSSFLRKKKKQASVAPVRGVRQLEGKRIALQKEANNARTRHQLISAQASVIDVVRASHWTPA